MIMSDDLYIDLHENTGDDFLVLYTYEDSEGIHPIGLFLDKDEIDLLDYTAYKVSIYNVSIKKEKLIGKKELFITGCHDYFVGYQLNDAFLDEAAASEYAAKWPDSFVWKLKIGECVQAAYDDNENSSEMLAIVSTEATEDIDCLYQIAEALNMLGITDSGTRRAGPAHGEDPIIEPEYGGGYPAYVVGTTSSMVVPTLNIKEEIYDDEELSELLTDAACRVIYNGYHKQFEIEVEYDESCDMECYRYHGKDLQKAKEIFENLYRAYTEDVFEYDKEWFMERLDKFEFSDGNLKKDICDFIKGL